jgi:hypothetical protein
MFLMIKNTLAQFISICECMFDTLVWLKFHKKLFDFNEDVYMCCAKPCHLVYFQDLHLHSRIRI